MSGQWSKLKWGESVDCHATPTIRSLGRTLDMRHDTHPTTVHPDLDREVGGWPGFDPMHLELLIIAIGTLVPKHAMTTRTIPASLTM